MRRWGSYQGIDETRQMKKEAKSPGREAIPGEELEPEEANLYPFEKY